MSVKRTQRERSDTTRSALITTARQLFAQQGYSDTGTGQIVKTAGLTRGALYHHFADKAALFRAVHEAVQAEVVAHVIAAAGQEDAPLDRLHVGADAFLEACTSLDVRQIALMDGPAVLGWEEWKRIDAQHGLELLEEALRQAMDIGDIRQQPVRTLARIMLGALTEGALHIAASEDEDAARHEVIEVVRNLIEGLRGGEQPAGHGGK